MVKGFVYILTHDSQKWRAVHPVIKIGCASNIKNRILELNTASPINLTLVASIQSDNMRALEHYLHSSFTRNRLNGEWFALDSQMINALRSQYLIGDRFAELFDLNLNIDNPKDVEIMALRAEIKSLKIALGEKSNELEKMKGVAVENALVRRGWNQFARGCKGKVNTRK